MNTTFHWRSQITALLSQEFLEICKLHLKPKGILYYNTTSSNDVVYTASHVFKYIVRFRNFIAVSDSPFDLSKDAKQKNLKMFHKDFNPFPAENPGTEAVIEELSMVLTNVAPEMLERKDLFLITDDNMATEYKKFRYLDSKLNWSHLF